MNIRPNLTIHPETHPSYPCSKEFIKYFEGYSYQEIARELNVPVSIVKVRIKETKKVLKDHLNTYCSSYKKA